MPRMSEIDLFPSLVAAGFISAAVVFVALLFFTAPYGRHTRAGWGPTINNRLGWILMETPAVLTILFCYLAAPRSLGLVPWLFLIFWEVHYMHRTCIFPFRLRGEGRRMPMLIVVSGMAFNIFNGYLNGRYLSHFAPPYAIDWLVDPRFITGALLFISGFIINLHSDRILFALRKPGETGYAIPRSGLYRWVSCPNYFGEIIEWIGWAILTWSVPGFVFAVWTAANLIPRALAHHRWYRQTFPDYPGNRTAVIPFVI